ncbi:bifunctional purine biosynthesis protein PurH [Marinicauda pacifica]|uniref:Bifunctional purine biosynthesis protein PurH n=1 Tax=Marinicauda pacifica TaxID=1133559 RepID=A0A4S2H910_9PROT|nr:bifunctional phosphoribosylaminoimidazolecarboxamide formyltransferase/IMP cyclohydrolase [Marinicauda pacifica]TGY92334.1 bifunctional phosphoribosylaminoimidazolecarboxamide formyltransferase/IMP cyclohydrolase [Marinicauda pacifica]GGE47984.1 bifunctional purine biosynthesis protein PurH [Marinicauda pacifica]
MADTDLYPVKRALISVSDKSGLVERARRLSKAGVELISTGGTLKALTEAGLKARDASEITQYPEMMDGRVKTLHPRIHGGLLARRDQEGDLASMEEHGIPQIDLLMVNLYPFEEAVASGTDLAGCIAKIDVGGPAMIRAAAKNQAHVCVCVDGEDLDSVLAAMDANDGQTPLNLRRKLAAKAFARTAAYDAAIAQRLAEEVEEPSQACFTQGGPLLKSLRYGENPHQKAALYATPEKRPGVASARQAQGKELSYNNLADADAAFELVSEFNPEERAAAVIVKHANPCGVATAETLADAYEKAFSADPVSAFGGIIALNRRIDAETADRIAKIFCEVVIAPAAEDAALDILSGKKNVRVMLTGKLADPTQPGWMVKSVAGGLLVQERDRGRIAQSALKTVTERAPSEDELADLMFAWTVVKHVKSNAIVYAKDLTTAGIGMGQTSRLEAARLALRKAEESARENDWVAPMTEGSVCASDAFFPFADGVKTAIEAGATAIIQPGGSIRDEEVIAAANEAGLAMVFTGMRHFRH